MIATETTPACEIRRGDHLLRAGRAVVGTNVDMYEDVLESDLLFRRRQLIPGL